MAAALDNDVTQAVQAVRDDNNPITWTVIAINLKQNEVYVVASGTEGGLDACAQNFPDDDARFALIRYDHKVDNTDNVRFAFVDWTPDSMKPMSKARISTKKGQIKRILDPYHVDLNASDRGDLVEADITRKIGIASGTLNLVMTEQRKKELTKEPQKKKKERNLIPKGGMHKKDTLQIDDSVFEGIKDVRKDDTDTNWMIAVYSASDKAIEKSEVGTGDADELISRLDESKVQYCFLRVTEYVDKSLTVKFVFIALMPMGELSPMKRAKYSTHRGAVFQGFQPFHFEFTIERKNEISADSIMQHVSGLTGTRSHVLEEKRQFVSKVSKKKKVFGPKKLKKKISCRLTDADEFKLAMKDFRDDNTSTNWLVACFTKNLELELLGTGVGTVDDMFTKCNENSCNFGIIRVEDVIDQSTTIKFALVVYQPEDLSPMFRAKMSIKTAVVKDLFAPFHVDFIIAKKSEITQKMIQDKVGVTSGSKSSVLKKKR